MELGQRKAKKEECKIDGFENAINNLLSKVGNRIDNIKKIYHVKYSIWSFDIDIDSNSEHNSPKIKEEKNSNNKISNNQEVILSIFITKII